jgi:hypothetical protein
VVDEQRPETWYPGYAREDKWSRSFRLLGIAAGLLYRYAREDQVHGGFTLGDLRDGMAIEPKRSGLFRRRRA